MIEGKIIIVDNIKKGRRTENKVMVMKRDRVKAKGGTMVVEKDREKGNDHGQGQIKEGEGSWPWRL